MSSYHIDRNNLPPTKIKRTYSCKSCDHKTINPRLHLNHLRVRHEQNIKIVECPLCVYACQYRQKLNRHLKLVHHCMPDLSRRVGTEDAIRAAASANLNQQKYSLPNNVINQNMFDSIKALASQKTPLYYRSSDEPMDLSFSSEVKQLLRAIESTQTQGFYDY